MIKRISDLPQRPTGIGAFALVLLVVLGVWWLNGGDPGTSTGANPDGYSSAINGQTTDSLVDEGTDPESGLPLVSLSSLPEEARETVELIDEGGPFPEDEDGATFVNYEGLLPGQERGYYQEYTVPTPGSRDRGARRLVEGDGEELYWTADHYASFARVLE